MRCGGVVVVVLLQCSTYQCLATGDAGKPLVFLRVTAEAAQGACRPDQYFNHRHRCYGASDFLTQSGEAVEAQVNAALTLGDIQPQQSGLGQRLPKFGVEALVLLVNDLEFVHFGKVTENLLGQLLHIAELF